MLYLSPSCGAVGAFLAGAGLGASISSPMKHKACWLFHTVYATFMKENISEPNTFLLHTWIFTYGANLSVAGCVSFRLLLLLLLISTLVLHIAQWHLTLLFLLLLIWKGRCTQSMLQTFVSGAVFLKHNVEVKCWVRTSRRVVVG